MHKKRLVSCVTPSTLCHSPPIIFYMLWLTPSVLDVHILRLAFANTIACVWSGHDFEATLWTFISASSHESHGQERTIKRLWLNRKLRAVQSIIYLLVWVAWIKYNTRNNMDSNHTLVRSEFTSFFFAFIARSKMEVETLSSIIDDCGQLV